MAAPALATPRDLAPLIDHTVLAPAATLADVARACDEALRHRFAAVCVRAAFAAEVRRRLRGAGVRTAVVIDFPGGAGSTAARVEEARAAVGQGAEELDLVVGLPAVRAGRWGEVLDDLAAVVAAAAPAPVKVILETAALDRDRKVAAAAVARAAGAAFLKTSTGFGPGGATVEDVALLRAIAGAALGVKASGGIRTAAQALALVEAGASRLGCSASVAIVEGAFGRPGDAPGAARY